MKKLIFILITMALTAFILAQAYHVYAAELVCDMNKGTLGNLELGSQTNEKEVSAAIGQNPKTDSFATSMSVSRYYTWLSLGLFITTYDEGNGEYLGFIEFCLNDGTGKKGPYKRFTGKFLPHVSSQDDIDSIKEKFGSPESIDTDNPRETVLGYKKPYGWVKFTFNKEGKLDLLYMSTRDD